MFGVVVCTLYQVFFLDVFAHFGFGDQKRHQVMFDDFGPPENPSALIYLFSSISII